MVQIPEVSRDTRKLAGVTPTAAGLALLGAADAAAQLAALGLSDTDDVAFAALAVADEGYGSGWIGDTTVPTKSALYDKIENGMVPNDGGTLTNASISGSTFDGGSISNYTTIDSATLTNCTIDSNNTFDSGINLSGANLNSPTITNPAITNGTIGSLASPLATGDGGTGTATGARSIVPYISINSFSPSSNTTYYLGPPAAPSTTAALRRFYVPSACTITKVRGWLAATNACSSEASTLVIRKNNSSDSGTVASPTFGASNSPATFSNSSINYALSAGDYFELKLTTPNPFTTAPTAAYGVIIIEFTS